MDVRKELPRNFTSWSSCGIILEGLLNVIEMNVDKLKSRYPGGEFDVHHSENRKEGDV